MAASRFLGHETLRVAGEEGCLSDVGQTQKQHDNALKANAAAGVGRAAVAERVQVSLDLLKVKAVFPGALLAVGKRSGEGGESIGTCSFAVSRNVGRHSQLLPARVASAPRGA